jgi:hypothetical protein
VAVRQGHLELRHGEQLRGAGGAQLCGIRRSAAREQHRVLRRLHGVAKYGKVLPV